MDHSTMTGMSSMTDMASSTAMSSMASMVATATGSAASMATSSSHSSMNMGGSGSSCKISMLWNWYTVDSCFIARSWHVTSKGMFAGSCIGVICLVIALEFLRRAGKEYDRFLLRQYQQAAAAGAAQQADNSQENLGSKASVAGQFRPNVFQQAIRALLHMLQFAVAYFIMLLAMYYNGYIIICIFIGAYIGFFIFGWEAVSLSGPKEEVTVCCG